MDKQKVCPERAGGPEGKEERLEWVILVSLRSNVVRKEEGSKELSEGRVWAGSGGVCGLALQTENAWNFLCVGRTTIVTATSRERKKLISQRSERSEACLIV